VGQEQERDTAKRIPEEHKMKGEEREEGAGCVPEEHKMMRRLKANANHLVHDTQGVYEPRRTLQQAVPHRRLGRIHLSRASPCQESRLWLTCRA
jgi:hypothetical protein